MFQIRTSPIQGYIHEAKSAWASLIKCVSVAKENGCVCNYTYQTLHLSHVYNVSDIFKMELLNGVTVIF